MIKRQNLNLHRRCFSGVLGFDAERRKSLLEFGRSGCVVLAVSVLCSIAFLSASTFSKEQTASAAVTTSWEFDGILAKGRLRRYIVTARSDGRYVVLLRWRHKNGNADLLVNRTGSGRVAVGNHSTSNRRYERLVVNFKKGQRYVAAVKIRSGARVHYDLLIKKVAELPSSSSSSSGSSTSSSSASSGSSTSSSSTSSGSSTGSSSTSSGSSTGSSSTSSGSSTGSSSTSSSSGSNGATYNAGYQYLDDANRGVKGGGFTTGMGYPRVMLTEPQATPQPWSRYTKYMAMATHASGMNAASSVQSTAPVPMHRMFTPSVTLETRFTSYGDCSHGLGISFRESSATTGGCGIWAGHFVYSAGSRLRSAMAANASSIQVEDASDFKVGRYVVIHGGGLKDFVNAEHAKITAINGNVISIGSRYKSVSRSRNAGTWVRMHEDGGRGTESWVFNLSTQCPRDPNGRTIAEYMVNWLATNNNIKRDLLGVPYTIDISGFTFDVDTYLDVFTDSSDVNNDLKTDKGISPTGQHWWGEGVDRFYSLLRARFPNHVLVGGVQLSGGYNSLNGLQIEGFPNGQIWRNTESYQELSKMFSLYLYRMKRSPYAPAMVQNLMKFGTREYPTHGSSRWGNAPMRLGLALTSMDAGFFHHENTRDYPDTWYDEYSVVSDKSEADFGRAVEHSNLSKVRSNRGWLGQPTGVFQRLYDEIDFKQENALFQHGFESDLNGWRTSNVSISLSTSQSMDGSRSLQISPPAQYTTDRFKARVTGPTVSLQQTQDYTLVFSARSSVDRSIQVKLGSMGDSFDVGTQWRRYVVPFRAAQSGQHALMIDVGLYSSTVNIDSIYLFPGDANIFRRDFDRGSVIANATPDAVSVRVGSGYRRIQGTQDSINNGAVVPDVVTIPAYDALFMLKR